MIFPKQLRKSVINSPCMSLAAIITGFYYQGGAFTDPNRGKADQSLPHARGEGLDPASPLPRVRGEAVDLPSKPSERPPRLQRQLFTSSSSSSQYSEEGWRASKREDSRGSEAGTTESWEFKSTLEAPIARLESLDELESSQVSNKDEDR